MPDATGGGGATSPEERLRHFPEEVRAAFARFLAERREEDLDRVLEAALVEYAPQKPGEVSLDAGVRLMEDLGFDSLAVTELVFFCEDLFRISIPNDDLPGLRTLGDLRAYVRARVAGA